MSKLLCKWVSEDMKTRNNTKWEVGVPNELPEQDDLMLCDEGLFHYCEHPLFAVLFKEFHRCENYTKLYEVVPEGKIIEGRDKCGATKLTLIKQLEIPNVNNNQKIAFGILCALKVYKEPKFVVWAEGWLSGEDRSKQAAHITACDAVNASVALGIKFYNKVKNKNCGVNAAAAACAITFAVENNDCNGIYNSIFFSLDHDESIDLIDLFKKAMRLGQ